MDNSAEYDDFAESCRPLKELLDSVRDIEGFPIGKDEDILSLSDPPYYTACPNPYINEFIDKFGKPYDEVNDMYECAPFVGDISEGKDDPLYKAHSYHTKVPHKAIMRFIEHYTKPGDLIFDGFCGSGMTGIAAQLTNRKAILNDLSSAATFISYNYNAPIDVLAFELETKRIISEVKNECGWMYETYHTDGRSKGVINYTVWSDVLGCPYCGNEYVYYQAAVDENNNSRKNYKCSDCGATISKQESKRSQVTLYDSTIGQTIKRNKRVPVLINYSLGRKRFEKFPDKYDHEILNKIDQLMIPYWFPTNEMMHKGERWGDTWRAGVHFGISNVHHFYTKRNMWLLAALYSKVSKYRPLFLSIILALNARASIRNRYMPEYGNRHVGTLSGTLYVPTLFEENNLIGSLTFRLNSVIRSLGLCAQFKKENVLISTGSLSNMGMIRSNSLDYIFTDPPFGDNLMYSELNYIWEAWLKVFTNNNSEAIINNSQQKSLYQYKELMTNCFKECHRILKPNRWITVEFHNSKASIWNAIQDSLVKAGFIIAQVAVIDKQKGTTKQLSYAGAVKNDLVINAYKPKKRFEESFLKRAGDGLERDFIEEHLDHLPIEVNLERTEQMLYSKMLAHYVQRGFEIKLNAKQFYALLRDNFKLIDGFWFIDKQILKYEEWKKKQGLSVIREIKTGQQVLFINDERSALVWLYNFLDTPKTFSDVSIAFNQAISSVEDQIPEPRELLSNNFISEGNSYRRPKNEKEQEVIEEQREKDLSRAFERILTESKTSGKKLKDIRKEAIAYGFTEAYREKRFQNIIEVAKQLDKKILEENSEISDFVEIAQVKLGVSL
ncbi:DNA methyltransferase [Chloroflexota bacterium]